MWRADAATSGPFRLQQRTRRYQIDLRERLAVCGCTVACICFALFAYFHFAQIGTSPCAGTLQAYGGRMEGNGQRKWNQQHQLALGTTLFVVCRSGRVFVCRWVSHVGAHGGGISGV